MVEFAINSSINATMGYAPFELNHRYTTIGAAYIVTYKTESMFGAFGLFIE